MMQMNIRKEQPDFSDGKMRVCMVDAEISFVENLYFFQPDRGETSKREIRFSVRWKLSFQTLKGACDDALFFGVVFIQNL